ncbi:MAG TPA: choice-of-anchor D domain-containing protein [Candidatus Acidoferrales bacterium]|nr:choice-of-anchor D domain-containing protein [Candidatus Acidoferrales bacterium]
MKKTLPVVVLALACVAIIVGVIHAPASMNSVASSLVLKPIAKKSVRAQAFARTVPARALARRSAVPTGDIAIGGPAGAERTIQRSPAQANSRERIAASLVSAHAVFEPAANADKNGAQFVGRANGMDVALTTTGIVVRVRPTDKGNPAPDTLRIHLKGAGGLVWHGEDKAQSESNYFVGNDPEKWRTHVARFQRVETADSGGLGLAVYGDGNDEGSRGGQGIEYDVRLDSGVDPAKVRLELSGARDVRIDQKGDLVLHLGGRELRMERPAIYEQISTFHTSSQRRKTTSNPRPRKSTSSRSRPHSSRGTRPPRINTRGSANTGRRRVRPSVYEGSRSPRKRPTKKIPSLPLGDNSVKRGASKTRPRASGPRESGHRIDGGYVLEADGSIGFWVGQHDRNAALVIDPSITVTYASFLGGTGADSVNSMAIDATGNVYVAGTTTSAATFPEAANGIEGNIRGTAQLFLAKIAISPTGADSLQYVTFFGGSNAQAGGEVAVDANGNAAVLGTTTSADYPVTDGRTPTQGLTGGTGNDLAVSEVAATGSDLIFSTIFGGNGSESANATAGTPLTSSLNIPAGQGGIAFDAPGNVYVVSDTTSTDLPTTGGAYQPAFGGKAASDGFIAEFQTQNVAQGANDLLYCSYLGTNSEGHISIGGVAVDSAMPPGVYVAGSTLNAFNGFPTRGAVQTAYGGGASDAFLMKFVPAGNGASDLVYATLLGGSGMDEALGVTVDSQTPPNAYVVGATQSLTFPENPAVAGPSTKLYQPSPPPGAPPIQNAFLAVVAWNPGAQTSSLQYFTYFGGSNQDAAQAVAASSPNGVYVSGSTTSSNFGWHDNVQPFNGAADAFLVKLDTTQSGAASLKYATPLAGSFITPGASVITLGNAIAADGQGDVYVAGETTAVNFPTALTSGGTINGFQQVCGSCQESPAQSDAFVAGVRESTASGPAVSFNVGKLSFGSTGVQIGTAAVPQPFAIINTGDAALNFSTTSPPTVTGANGGDFSITVASGAGCPQPLQPGQVCQAELNFVPSAAGLEGGVVSITDDAPGSPQLLEVTGTGVGPLTVSPASFAFGTVPLGDAPTKHDIEVSITAGLDVSNFSFTLSGPDTAQFAWEPLATPCVSGVVLTTGSSCDIWYAFAPITTGSFRAELDITGLINGAPITEKLPLAGTAVAALAVPITAPTQLIFRSEPLGSSETLSVLVSNTGTAPLTLTQPIGFTGTNASDFSQANDCPTSIAPDSWCTVYVQFAPQTTGAKVASLTITDNAPGSLQLVALSGTAVAPPQAQVAPASWDFGSQNVGTQSSPQTLTITNNGNVLLNFTQAIGVGGTNPADFQETNNCPISVAPGSSCNISVTFSPQSAGARSASINIANNAPGSPQDVPLAGTGVLLSQTQVTPTSLSFGTQVIGSLSAPQSISVRNTGSAPLIFEQIAFGGANGADFLESDNCLGNEIAPNLSCTVFVRFSPQLTGAKTASLAITDNAPGSPQTVSVSGTAAQPASIQVTPSMLNFATPQSVGTMSPAQTVTIVNQGSVAITFTQGASSIAIGGTDANDFSEASNCSVQSGLQPGSTCTVNVMFAPMSGGNQAAVLSIADSAPGSPQTVALSGTGIQANAQVSPTALSFNSQTVGTTSSAQTITVTSIGPGQPLNVTKVSFSGVNAADFAETDNCGGPVTATCAINVTFTPICANESASRSATLAIQDNGSVPSQTVPLTGTATGDFCVSASPGSMNETVAAGTTAVFPPTASPPISIISIGSFSGTVNLACSSNPVGPTCTFSPSAAITVSPNVPAQIEVQAATSVSSSAAAVWPEAGNWGKRLIWLATGLIALIVALGKGRRPRDLALAGAVLAVLCVALTSCGGGGGAGANVSSAPPPPLAGAYTLTVTANDGGETQTLSLRLNVTP